VKLANELVESDAIWLRRHGICAVAMYFT